MAESDGNSDARARRGVLSGGLDRLIDAIADPDRGGRAVPAIIAVYVLLWTLYGTIAKGSQDIHFDMGEAVVWAHQVTFGTPKHPPFSAWLAGAWFSVFPRQDWAFYLLSMTMIGVALWFTWRLCRRYVTGDKLAIALALPGFIPFYNFLGLKYNANSVMIPLWAFATWAFIRSFQTRRPGLAALAGLASAGVMLGKYWGVFLLAGFGLAALLDKRRAAYFRSPCPWVSIAAGLLALAPHLAWLAAHHFDAFGYALESHHASVWFGLRSIGPYLLGVTAYMIVPILIVAGGARTGPREAADVLWPAEPDRRLALTLFVLPLLLPLIAAVVTGSGLVSLWAIGAMTLLPVVLLSSPRLHVPRPVTRRIVGAAIAFPLLAIAAAPIAALAIHRAGLENNMAHYQLLTRAVEKAWHATTDRPLRIVGGDYHLINGVAFYARRRVLATYDVMTPGSTPWTDQARIDREGIAWVCPVAVADCVRAVEARAAAGPPGKRIEVTLTRRYMAVAGAPADYLIITTPPRQ